MRFLVSEVRTAGRLERKVSVEPSTVLGVAPEFVQYRHALNVYAEAVLTGTDIVVTGEISTTFGFTCGRCLENYERPFRGKLQQIYSLDQKEIDISPEVKEAVLLEMPITPVCHEGCKGLCATCGKNRNIAPCTCKAVAENPKWSALKDFRFKK